MTNIAAQIGAWEQRWPYVGFGLPEAPGTPAPVTFPTTRLGVRVELFIGGAWIDVTTYVLHGSKISITRGRGNERSTSAPATCTLWFKNADRRFSPRNVSGPWYGLFGRNTKIRVWVNPGSGDNLKFTGEVPDWTPRWPLAGDARTVEIQASGITRRLAQGSKPLNSPLYNTITNESRTVRYWPMEDGEDAESIASGLPGGIRAQFSGLTLASSTVLPGSKPLPVFASGGTWNAYLGWNDDQWQVDFHYYLPAAPGVDTVVCEWHSLAGTVGVWQFVVTAGGVVYAVKGYARDGSLLVNSSFSAIASNPVSGAPVHFLIYLRQNGGNVDWEHKHFPSLGGAGSFNNGSYAGAIGDLHRWQVPSSTGVANMVLAHPTVYDAYGFIQSGAPAWGYSGERATARFLRLAGEAGISATVAELVVDSQLMGTQSTTDLMSLLRDCEQVNEGLIDETVDGSLRLVSRTWRYNQPTALTLDYDQRQIQQIEPTDDDFALRNDWTINRTGGSFGRAEQTSGPNNVNDPADDPQGVSRYTDSATLNLRYDTQTDDHARWRVVQGTVDEQRYTAIGFDLARTPSLIPAWLACDIGSRVKMLNPPEDVGPDPVDQFIEGYTETFDMFDWFVQLHTSPASPYDIAVIGATTPRIDCGATTLAEDLDTTETGLDVLIEDTCHWVVSDGSYLIRVGAEDMLLTAVSAVSGSVPSRTQTLTVTRSVNGVTATHTTGDEVHVRYPIRLAL